MSRGWSKAEVAEAFNLYTNNVALSKIGLKFGVTRSSIQKLRDKHLWPKRAQANSGRITGNNRGKSWIGGHGYVFARISKEHVFYGMAFNSYKKSRTGIVLEHRLNMAEHINRPLKSYEVVHHIDHNRENNKIDNLLLVDDKHNILESRYIMCLKKRIKELEEALSPVRTNHE